MPSPMMAYASHMHMHDGFDLTIAGLIRKRAMVSGEIETLQEKMNLAIAQLNVIDQALRIFQPEIVLEELPTARVQPVNGAFRGEMTRFILTKLRDAPDGLTTWEMTNQIMEARSIATGDKALSQLMLKRTGHALIRLRAKGYVRSEKVDPGGMRRWWLVNPAMMVPVEPEWRNGSGNH